MSKLCIRVLLVVGVPVQSGSPARTAGADQIRVTIRASEATRLVSFGLGSLIGERVLRSNFLEIEEPDDATDQNHKWGQDAEQGPTSARDGVQLGVCICLSSSQRDDPGR